MDLACFSRQHRISFGSVSDTHLDVYKRQALYGTQAANGVILITTKKGQAGKQEVTFSSHFLFEKAISLPKFQNASGVCDGTESWGERTVAKSYDHAGDFFRRADPVLHESTDKSCQNPMNPLSHCLYSSDQNQALRPWQGSFQYPVP